MIFLNPIFCTCKQTKEAIPIWGYDSQFTRNHFYRSPMFETQWKCIWTTKKEIEQYERSYQPKFLIQNKGLG
jgi:hypothetical protein